MVERENTSGEVARLQARLRELEREVADLQRGAALLEPLLEKIPNIVARFDRALRLTWVNHYVPPLTAATALGRPLADFIAPSSLEIALPAIARVLETGVPAAYDSEGQGPNGTVAQYHTDVVAIREADGTLSGCLSVTDVTAVKRRERAVADREALLNMALTATGVGLWSWEIAGDRITWDERMLEILGVDEPLAMQVYTERLVHPDDREAVASDGPRLLAGEPVERTHRIVRPDGSERWVLAMGRMTRGPDGKPAAAVGGLIDVTSQRRFEDELRQSHRLHAVGTLTAGIAHNFNNLLTVILPNLELLRRVVPASHVAIVDDAHGAATRAADLVHQLMTYAGKRMRRAPTACDFGAVVERCVSICAPTLGGAIEVAHRIDAGLPAVRADGSDIEQVLMNLLFNARDALLSSGRERPCIVVEAGCADDADGSRRVVLRVVDNGPGMDAETLRRACEPFFTTKPIGAGTGLGLATSTAIARELGGGLELASQLGHGTTATLWLPALAASAAAAPTLAAATSASRASVLLVDDDPLVRRATSRLLELKGHHVCCAEDRERAEAAARAERFDVILLDRSLAGGAGGGAVARLRELAPSAQLLFFTGDELTDDETALVDGVVKKPVSGEQLLRAIAAPRARP
ncbi:MAG: PAS domain-containing protein [Deltaproteobacteria bacterium]|nr:PAS domain-containing protein [Deltaproteobacteria bacterium]